tara:strand:+ start:1009 stop:1152 length:144 start_codon:yes stop_codon:yes gene_type:complete
MITPLERQKLKDEIMEELLEEILDYLEDQKNREVPEEEAQGIIYEQH